MTDLTFIPSTCPGGRILLRLGQHDIGAVFPPVGNPPARLRWVWRFWLTSRTRGAKSELAATNALLSVAREWLQKAGL